MALSDRLTCRHRGRLWGNNGHRSTGKDKAKLSVGCHFGDLSAITLRIFQTPARSAAMRYAWRAAFSARNADGGLAYRTSDVASAAVRTMRRTAGTIVSYMKVMLSLRQANP